MRKVMIFGLPGSGKSTFAGKLSESLNLPLHHLDKYFYVRDWIEREYSEFLAIQQDLVGLNAWVIDGNSMKSLEMRFQNADTAIYFRFPLLICFWRMLKRVCHKEWPISDLAEGCSKSINLKLIKYMLRFHKRYYPKIRELQEKYPQVDFYLLKNDKQARKFLKEAR